LRSLNLRSLILQLKEICSHILQILFLTCVWCLNCFRILWRNSIV
jgi:hypothetical protein